MNTIFKTIFAVLALLFIATPAMAGEGIGTLTELLGTVRVTHVAAGQTAAQDMKPQDPIFMDDVIETDAGARAVFALADGAEMVITGQGKFTVDEYAYDAEKGTGKAVLDLLGLAFSYVGGKMDKNDDVKLNMEFGSIGIRGTKIMGVMRNGLNWIYLEEGAAQVSNKGGNTTLSPGFGTRISTKKEMPAPAYQWGEAEIAWLKRLVDDPASHETPLMASNITSSPAAGGAVNEAGGAAMESELGAPALDAGKDSSDEMKRSVPAERTFSKARENMEGARPAAPAASAPARAAEGVAARPKQAAATPLLFWEKVPPSMLGAKLAQDPSGALRIDARQYSWVSLAAVDIREHAQEGKTLAFTADVKAENLPKGVTVLDKAYLQMMLEFGDGSGKTFQRHVILKPYTPQEIAAAQKTGEWQTLSSEYTFGKDTTDFRANLNIVIKGQARVLVKNVKLTVR